MANSFGLLMLALCCAAFLVDVETQPAPEESTKPQSSLIRENFRITSLIDFVSFKTRFLKQYNSLIDVLRAQKMYLGRAIRSVLSQIKFKHRKSSSYLSVNAFSDMSHQQLAPSDHEPALEVDYSGLEEGSKGSQMQSQLLDESSEDMGGALDIAQNSTKVIYSRNHPSDDRVDYDWRSSGCLSAPRQQGKCASCYVFAAIAMFEYALCKVNGILSLFSEQFVLECGFLLGLKGCAGGKMAHVAEFVAKHGLEPLERVPYKAPELDPTCPHRPAVEGSIRVADASLHVFGRDQFEAQIARGPFMTGIKCPLTLREYGGGVLLCTMTQSSFSHALLMVGSGREDGIEYWLYRNSWGSEWGLEGHVKINKDSECLKNQKGLFPQMLQQRIGTN